MNGNEMTLTVKGRKHRLEAREDHEPTMSDREFLQSMEAFLLSLRKKNVDALKVCEDEAMKPYFRGKMDAYSLMADEIAEQLSGRKAR